ncbi:WXG100 family type VII secretion target [Kibdelosporangium aridum]|uniref:WXG100 family type VII secretion target n=1 Tax=Kibdelosporangium aridum TaxID=2030 RepID=UPI0035E69012
MNNLDYLSQLCRDLGVPDIVEEYFAPVVGRWSDMHEEADRWRTAATAADEVTASLNKPLGALDAAWEGKTADSFVDYMQTVGLAGNDMSDAMHAMAKVLDKTADGIREIVMEMGDVLSDTAEASAQSMAMPLGEERTRQHIETMRKPIRESFESVRQVLEAFVNLCDGVDGSKAFERVKMSHTYPTENWTVDIDVPAEPPAHQTAEPAAASVGVSGGCRCGRWRGRGCGRWRNYRCGYWRGCQCGGWRSRRCERQRSCGCGRVACFWWVACCRGWWRSRCRWRAARFPWWAARQSACALRPRGFRRDRRGEPGPAASTGSRCSGGQAGRGRWDGDGRRDDGAADDVRWCPWRWKPGAHQQNPCRQRPQRPLRRTG